jgi:inosose dehydratase
VFIATNVYSWSQRDRAAGREFNRPAAMAAAKSAGLSGWEDSFRSPDQVSAVARDAAMAGLAMRSAYVFGAFHEDALAEKSIANALAICDALRPHGVTLFISNPDPLPGGTAKTDAQLRTQSKALESLGRSIREQGGTLLYHAHTPEMQASAREFHHMLAATDPAVLSLCLDIHWIYRGTGDSMVALEDIIRLYGPRVSELHLRQSRNGIWDETFSDGDIDLTVVADMLAERGVRALPVLELAAEEGTPSTMDPITAHATSVATVQKIFGAIAA